MANAAGFIQESIWRDEHWRRLSRSAQALYMQLLSQKELDCAGVLPLQPNKWAKGCSEVTTEDVLEDLKELQRERFVFFDYDTDEAFIRTYVRNSNVVKIPNMRKSARRAALLIGSEQIRQLLAAELRATEHPEFVALADEINGSPNGSPDPSPNPSKTTVEEPLPEPTGVGTGLGVGVTLVSSHLGEKPSEFCQSHPKGTDTGCFACGQARRSFPERKAQWEKHLKEAAALQRQAAIDKCLLCDEFGDITFDDSVRKCDHQEQAHA
jgi:hypothetical protein